MLQLGFPKPLDVNEVRKAKRIELGLTSDQSTKVLRLWQERQALAGRGATDGSADPLGRCASAEGRAAPCLITHCVEHHIEERPLLLCENGRGHDAGVREHRQATVAELLDLHLILAFRILGVEATKTEVSGLAIRLSLPHVHISEESKDLQKSAPDEDLRHSSELHHGIVSFNGRNLESITGNSKSQVRSDPSDSCKHCHAAVLQLRFTKPTNLESQGEAHRVKALLLTGDALQSW
mmetsp:Transcript_38150/g.78060  ORF Transcript_38150/g.78060 Transcript_38150/m.78060 type:complete len:237 (-) Transcript_38150:1077-1787(-)